MLSRFWPAFVLVVGVVTISCDRVPLLGPSGSTITITAQSLTLAPGGRTEVTATVMESAGTPVHDGTLVRFSASLGTLQPPDVETRGGVARTTFVAGSASGTAQIRASSGAASGGEGDAPANAVSIAIGGAAAQALTVTASPSRVGPSGGTVTLIASALDGSGNRLPGVPVTFSTTAGTLSASSAIADSSGEARVALTTNREATVTARAGNQSATATVSVATAGTVGLTTTPATPVSGSPVTLTVTPATGTTPRVIVTWGDGASDDLGIVAAPRSITHTYQQSGSYTITAQSTADGESFSTAISVTVGSAAAGLTLTGPDSGTVGATVVFTVTPGAGTTPRVVLEWGDGSSSDLGTVTAARSVTHAYSEAGTYIVTASATASGDTFVTSRAITIGARAPVSVTVSRSSANVDRCEEVTFTANASTTAGDPVASYEWNSGGGTNDTTSGATLTTEYSTQGTKTVQVRVTTSSGRTGTGTTTVTVLDAGPATCS
jgi:hypothetical protein